MDFESDLIREIQREEKNSDELIFQAKEILAKDEIKLFHLLENEGDRLVSIKVIEKICLKYRLRFLPDSFFKNEIPIEAKIEMNKLTQKYNLKSKRLKIIAPSSLFKLENREKDPILLLEISKDKFLIIYKWGKEFSKLRSFKALPFRNVLTMILSIAVIALTFSICLLPFTGGSNLQIDQFLFGFAVVWMGCLSYGLFIVLSQNIYPTSLIWNSKFLD